MDLTKLHDLKAKYNLLLVEDAACAIGSSYKGKKVGTFSDISCFSFHPRKVLTTGEGGMVCTNNETHADNLRRFLNHGFKADMTDFKFPGLNYRMTEVQAILGSFGLKEIDDRIKKRRRFKDEYFKLLSKMDNFSIPENSPGHNWQTFLVFPKKKINRPQVLEYMNQKGVNAIRGTYSLISLDFYKNKYGDFSDLENSKYLDQQAIALPFSEDYGPEDAKKVVSILLEATK
jgi:dTDP-4-amino-4,6-dideoxygalactose transaminase